MAKRKSKSKSKKTVTTEVENETHDVDEGTSESEKNHSKLTLEALDAISDEDGPFDEDDDDDKMEWNAEAKALRQAIQEGAFDKLLSSGGKDKDSTLKNLSKKQKTKDDTIADDTVEDKMQEVKLEDDSSDEEKANDKSTGKDTQKTVISNPKALDSVTKELEATKHGMVWAETFDVVPKTPLPFGPNDPDGNPLDVHDDLKREVAFYNLALESVHIARKKCEQAKISFTRPVDFFAEMVKTDDHMAKVKDRLIFETKKMDAFEQRKSNREQKLRAKEKHAHRLDEKAKAKRTHMKAVEEWAKDAKSNRLGGGRVHDNDDEYLNKFSGPGQKRMNANKKYGFGGKRGRFKQNDSKSMNDMSGFNPRGNFAGGQKKSGAGSKRKGKRARDSAKSR
jgi:rRNA-processing protein EBP2